MQLLKHLRFSALVSEFKQQLKESKDTRRNKSCDYDLLDCLSSGLACMFYKSPSMMAYQNAMKKKCYRNNLQTQFGVINTPKDNQMRKMIGQVDSKTFEPVYKGLFNRLQRNKQLTHFRYKHYYFNTLDGTQYYGSENIHCDDCLEQKKRNGKIHYSHKVMQSVISHPDVRQVIPMMPEEINQQDGSTKEDCEINATKRLIPKIRAAHPRLPFIWMGDSLFANTSIINLIHEKEDKFIFNAKSGDHKTLYKNLAGVIWNRRDTQGDKGRIMRHEWVDNIPLTKAGDVTVSVMRLMILTPKDSGIHDVTYKGTWITDLDIDTGNIVFLVRAARNRWKIENECFNTLKNNGYNLEHNWGHDYGDSPFNFYHLTVLSFYMHQILELTDKLYGYCRSLSHAAYELWGELTVLFRRILYDSWEDLLCDYIDGYRDHDPPSYTFV